MKAPRRVFGLAAFPLLVGLAATPPEALPQAPPAPVSEGDLDPYAEQSPSSAQEDGSVYARLRQVEGTVSLTRESQIRDDLTLNEPVIPGDRIDSADGRAEVQFSDGTILRLDRGTSLIVRSLSDNANQIENSTILQLPAGSLIVRSDRLDSRMERFQIDTPAASVFILSEGLFRIDVRPDGPTVISSRGGAAEVMANDVSTIVRSGERSFVTQGQAPLRPQVYNTLRADDFDEWSSARDEALLYRETAQTRIPPGLPDPVEPYAEELSYHGQWIHTPSFGWVWRPVGVTQDWRPYYNGHWVWSPAGMVWASYEPWGWAPYHYGRWEFLVGGGWVWIPGYVYSGGHVAWLYSPGYFGWAPLGYYDYPVHIGFHFGFFYSPWVYVHGHHLYHHNVHTVCVREKTIIQNIEKQYVVVGGSPRIRPEQVARRPQIADEVHRRVAARREIQMDTTRNGRQIPFHENERQQLARATSQRSRDAGVGVRSVGRNGGRPVTLVPQTRGVTVPRTGQRPGNGSTPNATPGATTRRPGTQTSTSAPGAQNRGASRTGQPRKEPVLRPGSATPAEESVPRQVIPRIIPRGSSNGNTSTPGRPAQPSAPGGQRAEPQKPETQKQQPGKTTTPRKTPARKQPKKATTGSDQPAEEKSSEGSGGPRVSRASRGAAVVRAQRPANTASTGNSGARAASTHRPIPSAVRLATQAPGAPQRSGAAGSMFKRSSAASSSGRPASTRSASATSSAPQRSGAVGSMFKRTSSPAPSSPARSVSAPSRARSPQSISSPAKSGGAPKASVSRGGGAPKSSSSSASKGSRPSRGNRAKNR